MNAALTVSGLTVGYSSRGRLTEAVTDISFEIPAGGRAGLVGESGSGKTTVAMAILNYLPRNATILGGAIEFDGRNLLEMSTVELTAVRGRRIAAVYQDPGSSLNPTIPIGRQVGEVFELHLGMDRRESRQAAVAALDRVQLPSPDLVATRYPHELSGGQQQRVMIAMALAASPSLLLLDEPTTGLDATVEAGVIELIEELSRDTGTALLMVSHNLPLVRHLCEDAVVMRAGRVVEAGPTATLLRTPSEEYTRGLVASVPTRSHRKFTNVVRAAGEAERPVPPRRLDEIGALADSDDIVLSIKDLVKKYDTNEGVVHAIRGVDLDMRRGEILAIVGESGSGKSTLAKCVVGLESFSSGSIALDGAEMPRNHRRRDRSAAARRPTLVFQNPETSLNPTKTARAVLRQALRLGGDDPAKVDAIGAETQLTERHLDSKTRRLSGGLKQRVAIARASVGGPAIVVCDEPVSALDVSVQAGILNLLAQRQADAGASYLFISHDLDVVHYLADSVAVMYMGEIVERGTTEAVFAAPHHPYTAVLLSASLSAEGERIRLQGQAPSAYHESVGCIFASRCPVALDDGSCSTTTPPWREGPGEKHYRCHRTPGELVPEPAAQPAVPSGSL